MMEEEALPSQWMERQEMKRPKRIRRFAVRVSDDLHEQVSRIAEGAPLSLTLTAALRLLVAADTLLREARR